MGRKKKSKSELLGKVASVRLGVMETGLIVKLRRRYPRYRDDSQVIRESLYKWGQMEGFVQ